MSRADILSHNCILMKLLKYYLTSGTSEKNQTLGIIIQVLFLFVFFPPPPIFKFLCGKKTSDKEVKLNLTHASKKTVSL